MLSKKQLEDAANCRKMDCIKGCNMCTNEEGVCSECTEQVAQMAIAFSNMLERHVWHKRSSDGKELCIECRNLKETGHTSNCELAAMLKEG